MDIILTFDSRALIERMKRTPAVHRASTNSASLDPAHLSGLSLTGDQLRLLAERGVAPDAIMTLATERLDQLVSDDHLRAAHELPVLVQACGKAGATPLINRFFASVSHEDLPEDKRFILLHGIAAHGTETQIYPLLFRTLEDAGSVLYSPLHQVAESLLQAPWMTPDHRDDFEAAARQRRIERVTKRSDVEKRQLGSGHSYTDPIDSFEMGLLSNDRVVWERAVSQVRTARSDDTYAEGQSLLSVDQHPLDIAQVALHALKRGLSDPRAASRIRRHQELPDVLVSLLGQTDSHARLQASAVSLLADLHTS